MAAAAYRQIAEVQQSQGSEEQQEPPQKKLRLGTTEAVFAHRHRRFHNEVDLCWDKAYHDATRQGLPEWQVLEIYNQAHRQQKNLQVKHQQKMMQFAKVQRLRRIRQNEQEEHDRLQDKYREKHESECRRLREDAERFTEGYPKKESDIDWAECYLNGSAAPAHAKIMNATSSSHANREVDDDMEQFSCRSCGGGISYPNFSCPAGSDPE